MNNNNSILLFIRRNIFCILCFLLFSLVLVTCSLSFGKYNVSNKNDGNSNIGSFSVSTSIDSVTGTSFTNTAYWGSSSDNSESQTAMNAKRTLSFSINNFKEENGIKKVSDVKLKYNLSFSTPKNFAEKLAMQVFDENDNPLLPQIVISNLIAVCTSSGTGTYKTVDSKDYGGTDTDDLEFNVEKTDNDNNFSATSDTTTIKINKETKQTTQTLLFRLWDLDDLTSDTNKEVDNEGGKLLSPLEVTYTEKIEFYNITISMDNFILPAGKEQTARLNIKLVPIETISDQDLGGTIVDVIKDSKNEIISSTRIKEIYADKDKEWYIQYITDNVTESQYDNPAFVGSSSEISSSLVEGSTTIYKDGSETENTYEKGDEILESPQTFTTTTLTANKINWGEYEILDGKAPTKNDYTTDYVAKTVRSAGYGTIFFIHKLEVERIGTQEITEKMIETKIESSDSIQKQTKVNEKTLVQRLDGENDVILLNITKTTTTTYSGEMTINKIITTTKYERTYTQTGFIYRGYYVASNGEFRYWGDKADTSEKLQNDRAESLKVIDYGGSGLSIEEGEQDKYYTGDEYFIERINVSDVIQDDDDENKDISTKTSRESSSAPISTTETEYIQKKIEREYKYHKITIGTCKQNTTGENGTVTANEYIEGNKLTLYDERNIQKYFLSQCYSKSYPFEVNVIFEQTQ